MATFVLIWALIPLAVVPFLCPPIALTGAGGWMLAMAQVWASR